MGAQADGIPFTNDRIIDTPTTTLDLSASQRANLKRSKIQKIKLTDTQKEKLKQAAGFSPDEIEIWPLHEAKDTCTCELLNIGVRISDANIQVPHFLLGPNFEKRGKNQPQS